MKRALAVSLPYAIVAAIVGAIYVAIVNFFPDFPIPADLFLEVAIWVLVVLLGVDVVGKPAAFAIEKKFPKLFK